MKPEELKRWRLSRALTQQGAADSLGVSKRAYLNWERGERVIPHTTELAIRRGAIIENTVLRLEASGPLDRRGLARELRALLENIREPNDD